MPNISYIKKFLIFALFIITILGVTAGIGILIKHNTDKSINAPSKAGNWNAKQTHSFKKSVIKYLTTQIDPSFDKGIARCVANLIEQKYSYQQVLSPGTSNPMNKDITVMVAPCAGKKGDWNNAFKASIYKRIINNNPGFAEKCVKCVVNLLEQHISPTDFIGLSTNSQLNNINYMLSLCKKSCGK